MIEFSDLLYKSSFPASSIKVIQSSTLFSLLFTISVSLVAHLIIDSYFIGMTISYEVEVMDWTGFVDEGKSVSR